jgi:hypothetical protein
MEILAFWLVPFSRFPEFPVPQTCSLYSPYSHNSFFPKIMYCLVRLLYIIYISCYTIRRLNLFNHPEEYYLDPLKVIMECLRKGTLLAF